MTRPMLHNGGGCIRPTTISDSMANVPRYTVSAA